MNNDLGRLATNLSQSGSLLVDGHLMACSSNCDCCSNPSQTTSHDSDITSGFHHEHISSARLPRIQLGRVSLALDPNARRALESERSGLLIQIPWRLARSAVAYRLEKPPFTISRVRRIRTCFNHQAVDSTPTVEISGHLACRVCCWSWPVHCSIMALTRRDRQCNHGLDWSLVGDRSPKFFSIA